MKKYTPQEATEKIHRYCAYQERSHSEVRQKLLEYGIGYRDTDEIIVQLIEGGFLNEERYAKAFAGGKFRIKKWGRLKIVKALEGKGLSNNCIKSGLNEISEDDYEKTLTELLEKKAQLLEEENIFVKRDKLSQYAIQKGYEPDIVWRVLRKLLPD